MNARDLLDAIARATEPLKNRVANSIARAVIQRVDDTTQMQELQLGVLAGETVDDGERFQSYGFSSVPFEGAEAAVVFPGGDRGHPLVVGVNDRRHRPTGGTAGEVVMYTDEGDEIRLGRGNIAVVKSGDIRLGSSSASDPVALKSDLDALKQVFADWIPAGADGGASLKVIIKDGVSGVGGPWNPTGAAKVKAE